LEFEFESLRIRYVLVCTSDLLLFYDENSSLDEEMMVQFASCYDIDDCDAFLMSF
jgi:hypothetical protein